MSVTATVPPTLAPVSRMVAAPSMISRSAAGWRPSTAASSTGPRTGATAKARTCLPLICTSVSTDSVIWPMAGSLRSLVRTSPVTFLAESGSPSEAK